MMRSVYACCPRKNLEPVPKAVTLVCLEEDNARFTPVTYLVLSLEVLFDGSFLIRN